MAAVNLDQIIENLEREELNSRNGIADVKVYSQLLTLYLYQYDLCNAKFLWKRIPADVKSANPELARIWAVGQSMWKKDFPGIYKALNENSWSEDISDIMKNVQEKVRSKAVDLISLAYSSVSLDTVAHMTGLTVDVAGAACLEKGWQVDPDTKMVHPVRPVPVETGHINSEDQLYKLTDFVSFLEN